MARNRLVGLMALSWFLVICAGTYLSGEHGFPAKLLTVASYALPSHALGWGALIARKLGHLLVFGILATMLWSAGHSRRGAWVLASLAGMLDEVHQGFVAGRTSSLLDVLVNALGALVGLLVLGQLSRSSQLMPHRKMATVDHKR